MHQGKISFWNSLVIRFALFFISLILFAVVISGYLVYNKASTVITEYSKESVKFSSNLAKQSFLALLDEVSNDIAVLSENPTLQTYVQSPSIENKQVLQDLFRVTLKNKVSYFQLRLISATEFGKEKVRVEKVKENEIVIVSDDNLQFKGDRPYFKEALKVSRNKYYFSNIDLNEEYGVLSIPYIPTLRAASPIYSQSNEIASIMVINVDLSGFYEDLNRIMQSGIELMIVDESGQYLFSPNPEKQFGKQLKSGESFAKDFNRSIPELINGSQDFDRLKDKDGLSMLYNIEELHFSDEFGKVYLISIIEESAILESAYDVRDDSFSIILIICFVALIFALAFTQVFSRSILQITHAMSSYDEGGSVKEPTYLPENRRDEIGLLAKTFNKMKLKINQQVDELRISLGKEQKATQERDEFLQNMSHELRTPLNGILGLTQLLIEKNPSSEQLPIINSLNRSAKNLAGLMYDILDHQKLLEGRVSLKHSASNIYELLYDIHVSYQFEALKKGLKFDLDIDESLKTGWYQMDPLRFTQIVTNLVVNALKFTKQGYVILTAKALLKDNPQLLIIVEDSGVGILPENLKKIQDRFYKEKDGESGKDAGFGLGLSIVKQLLDLFGGTLDVQSQKDVGSTFSVTFPSIKAIESTSVKRNAYSKLKRPLLRNEYRVLHIEDDDSSKQLVKYLLEDEKIEIVQKSTLSSALSYLEGNSPDLIISDMMIDNQLIDENLKAIQCEKESCPIVIVSAFDKERVSKIGLFQLQKPVDNDVLIDIVYVVLGKKEFDQPKLKATYELYDNSKEKILSFLEILTNEFEKYVERIERAYMTKDPKEWSAIIHKMTTHIKSLELKQLSTFIPEEIVDLDEVGLGKIKNSMYYFLCYFRLELIAISKD